MFKFDVVIYLYLITSAYAIISKKLLLNPNVTKFFAMFSSGNIIALDFMFRSLIHLDLIFEFYLLPTPSSETRASIPKCSLTKSLFPFPHSHSLSQFWNSWLLAFLGKEVSNKRADRIVLKLTWVVTEVILHCDFRKSVSMLHAFPWS